MKTLAAFVLGVMASKWIFAHVALQVLAWHPLALKVWVK